MGIEYFMVRDIVSHVTRTHDSDSSRCSKCHRKTGDLINYMCEECYNSNWKKKFSRNYKLSR